MCKASCYGEEYTRTGEVSDREGVSTLGELQEKKYVPRQNEDQIPDDTVGKAAKFLAVKWKTLGGTTP